MKNLVLYLLLIAVFYSLPDNNLFAQSAIQPIGSGTISDPYHVETLSNLYWITQNKDSWSNHFIQTADIDATETAVWNGGAGFPKIGYGEWFSLAFNGTYDGQYHIIDGLTINQPDSNYVGMFGFLRETAKVCNLGLINSNITGFNYTGSLVGGIMLSVNDTAVINCFSRGTVNAHSSGGGLIGYAGNALIINCFSSGTVTTTAGSCGGLAGIIYNDASVLQCCSQADVTDSGTNSGGLVGRTDANCIIRNCFSTGQVDGYEQVGGLTGKCSSGCEVSNCYSTGIVTGTYYVGGFLGFLSGGTVTSCFWDTESSGQLTSAAGTGLPTTTMKTESTFISAGWDFAYETDNGTNDYWVIEGAANSGYPILGSWMLASVETGEVTSITQTTAACGGNVSAAGLFASVSAKGVVWGTSGNPTLALCEAFTNDGSGPGSFISALTNLSDGTEYYVRAYATNDTGTSYGEQKTFTTQLSPPGNALYFNGSNEYVTANTVCQILNNPAAFTMECWFCPTFGGATSPYLLAFNNSDGSNSIMIGTSSDYKIKLYTGSASYYGTTTLHPGLWHHVALTIDASNNAILYLNGLAETVNTVSVRPPVTGKFSIGQEWDGSTPTDFYQGKVDEVRIWNVARTQQQIRDNIHQIIEPVPAELVAYFSCDEPAGSVLPDISGNGNIGSLVNMDDSNWVPAEWPYGAPYVITANVSDITTNTATSGGEVALEGNTAVISRGVVWDTNENPSLTSNTGFTTDGSGLGTYISEITGLQANTAYFVRAYAINSSDTCYGAVIRFETEMLPPGYCLDFDGSNDYVSCGTGPVITGAAPRSIEAWAYTRAFNGGGIFQAGATGTNNRDFSFRTTSTDENWRINLWGDANDINLVLPGSKNAWHHYCLTYDGTRVKLYYDGYLVADEIRSLNTQSHDFWIGLWLDTEFNGMIDEVRVWNTARTQQEIRQNMHLTIDTITSDLRAYYSFDEDEGTTLPDFSVNGYNGTLYNMNNSDWVPATWKYGCAYVTTAALSDFSYQSLTCGGNVLVEGTSPVSSRGVIWSFSSDPGLSNCQGYTTDGSGTGSFISNIAGLSQGLTYYFRAYAINTADTSYGQVVSYTTGIEAPSRALNFDGSNDYVTIANESAFDFTGSMTVEAWIYVDAFTKQWQAIITKGDDAWRIQRYNNTNFVCFDTDGTSIETLAGTTNVNDGKWHHIAGVYDGSAKYLYVDGHLDNMVATTGNINTNDYFVMLGENAQNTGRQFDGKIDEVRIYNTALDSITIREHIHHTLQGNEPGLVAYYQFVENNGTTLHDFLNNHHGTLNNMTSPQCWIQSPVPVGSGVSVTRTETTGTVDFSGTGVSMFYHTQNEASLTVSRIDTVPNILPFFGIDTVFSKQYWVINRFGTGSFDVDVKFWPEEDLEEFDEEYPSNLKIFSRSSNSTDSWTLLKPADSVNADENFIVFNNISGFSQFIIGRVNLPSISVSPSNLVFGGIIPGDSATSILRVINNGTDDLALTGIVSSHSAFTVNLSSCIIPPGKHEIVEVKFKPTDYSINNGTINVYSNDPENPVIIITLTGKANEPVLSLIQLPFSVIQQTTNFNSIDIGYNASPCFTDLDSDRKIDLIIGKQNGTLSHYEQQSENSTSFTLISNNFNSINVGSNYSSPAITDFNNDGLLDLLVGENDGNLNYYVQRNAGSLAFDLVTDDFNGIDVGDESSPCFSDIDNDNLTDLLIGEEYWNLNHYEQIHPDSSIFTLVTQSFNSINIGYNTRPMITDINLDGLLDLIIGDYYGNIKLFKQQSPNSLIFEQADELLNSIDVGNYAVPRFTDFNEDGVWDLIIGNYYGRLYHYVPQETDSMIFHKIAPGSTSVQPYLIISRFLTGNMVLSSTNAAFTLSTNKYSGFSTNLTLSPTDNLISDTVFVRFQPLTVSQYSGFIRHTSSQMDTLNFLLRGESALADIFPGHCLDFDGNDDYVNCGQNAQVTGNHPRTIEAWAYTRSFNNGGIFQAGQTGTQNTDFSLRTLTTNNLWRMQFFGNDLDVTLPDSKNQWHHYCLTYDGTNAKLYFDGKLMGQKTIVLNTGLHEVWFGQWEDNSFDGKIDEVRIWNYALDSIQIRENMHLHLNGTELGLTGYWQFNEAEGGLLIDIAGSNTGLLSNMDNNDWLLSTIPMGDGASDSQIETNGMLEFAGTGFSAYYSTHTGAAVTATKIDSIPNILPADLDTVFSGQYWAVNRYGAGSFNADLTFHLKEDLTSEDETVPQNLWLYARPSTSDRDWTLLKTADSANATDDFVVFREISGLSQFIIGRKSTSEISVSHTRLNFGKVISGDSASLVITIKNTGSDTLFLYDLAINHTDYVLNVTSDTLIPWEEVPVVIKFIPQNLMFYQNQLTIYSNDPNEQEIIVDLSGEVIRSSCITTQLPVFFDLLTENFSSINVNYASAPQILDLNKDGFLDLITGADNGKLYHYTQEGPFYETFEFKSDFFSNIAVDGHSKPCFTDLDRDGLLDLIIGGSNGTLSHYEQESEYSLTFVLVTDYFNSIDVGNHSAPCIKDIDEDGLLDLLVGEEGSNLNHYEQQSQFSHVFVLKTPGFCSIDINSRGVPFFTDLNEDGYSDLIIGNFIGNLYHYRQQSKQSEYFNFVTDNFSPSISATRFTPWITDLDQDGFTDLILGEYSGNLNHFEQCKVDSLFFSIQLRGNSSTKYYHVKANPLTGNMEIVSSNSGYSISLFMDSGFTDHLTLSPVNGIVSDTIYVKFAPDAIMEYTAFLRHTATNMDTTYVILNGSGVETANFPGNALDFDGGNDYVNCGSAIQVTGGNPRSVEAWAYTRSFNDGGIFRAGTSSNLKDFSLRTTTTDNLWKMQFWGNDYDVMLPESKNAWHHYCMTYDGTSARLYYDGKLMATNSVALNTGKNDLSIGKWEFKYFNGKIDEVRFWNYALDSIEIRERMHLNLTGFESGLQGYWQFNEGSGSIAYSPVDGSIAYLMNMNSDDWVASSVPFGGGAADSQTETYGQVDFNNTGLSMYFISQTGSEITASRIDTIPNTIPGMPFYTFSSQYWVVNRYGSGNYLADITLTLSEDLTADDQADPSSIGLWTRGNTADTNWAFLAQANIVNAETNQATFPDISASGQFIITKTNIPVISVNPEPLDFGNVVVWTSAIQILEISNNGSDTLIVTDIIAGDTSLIVPSGTYIILPGEVVNIEVVFKAGGVGLFENTITILSNAPFQPSLIMRVTASVIIPDNFPGNALHFDGFNEYVNCGTAPVITGNNSRTIMAWAYTESFHEGAIFQAGKTGIQNQDFSLRTTYIENQWRMQFWGNDKDVVLPDSKNKWHHYCMTYDGMVACLYYDGRLMATHNISLNTGINNFLIGKWENRFFKGKIDELRIWDRALDSLEIRENMHQNMHNSFSGLKGYWQFNETGGNTLPDIIAGNDGQLISIENNNWQVSTILFGGGTADSQSETAGIVLFEGTGLAMNFSIQTGAEVTVNRIDTLPNLNPLSPETVLDDQYWILKRYGSGNYQAEITFTVAEDLRISDENNPSNISLYQRNGMMDTDWSFITSAISVNALTNQVTFPGITISGQFIIAREVEPAGIQTDLTVFLEGPFNGINMNTDINTLLPLSQPFNKEPWNYPGAEAVATIPNTDVVDWVLVELREATDAASASSATIIGQQATFLLKDGSIVSIDGFSLPLFTYIPVNNLFAVIWHRNSVGVMTANPLTEGGGIYTYNFTSGAGQAFGGTLGHKEIAPGIWGMTAGDGNSDNQVNNSDKNNIWKPQSGSSGYVSGDFNLDSQVNNVDKNLVWKPNTGSGGQVPQ